MKRINLNRIYFEYIQSPLEDSLAKLSIYLKNDRVDIFDRRFIKMGNPKLPTKLLSACKPGARNWSLEPDIETLNNSFTLTVTLNFTDWV